MSSRLKNCERSLNASSQPPVALSSQFPLPPECDPTSTWACNGQILIGINIQRVSPALCTGGTVAGNLREQRGEEEGASSNCKTGWLGFCTTLKCRRNSPKVSIMYGPKHGSLCLKQHQE